MATPFTILEASAMPYEMKRRIMTQELIRRIVLTMDKYSSQAERDIVINKFKLGLSEKSSQRNDCIWTEGL